MSIEINQDTQLPMENETHTIHHDHNILTRARELANSGYDLIRNYGALIGTTAVAAVGGVATETAMASVAEHHGARAQKAVNQTPINPNQIIYRLNGYYNQEVLDGSTNQFDLQRMVLRAHYFLKAGKCHPNDPDSNVDTRLRVDSLKGEETVTCTKTNGNDTYFVPRQHFGYLPAARHMDFIPVLDGVGNAAAQSVGIAAAQHGTPANIEVTKSGHTTEASITYAKGSGGSRELRELKLRAVGKGKTVAHKTWYK